MDKVIPIKKYACKRDLVVQTLRGMILSGEIVPGQRLRQEELSRMLGVSATPIREAIRLLEADGLLYGEPHRGVSVVEVDADGLQDLGSIRSVLEALATRQAVERSDPQTYASTLERLEFLQREMEACVESTILDRIANLNREFHLLLCDLSRSPYLVDMIRRLWMHQPGYLVWQSRELAKASVNHHRQILEALRARQSEAAARAMQVHIELSAISLLKDLEGRELAKPGAASERRTAAKTRGRLGNE